MYSSSSDGSASSAAWSCDPPRKRLPGAIRRRSVLIRRTACTTSKRRARPGIPYDLSDGVTARQMVFSVRLASATTRCVFRGSSPRSTHSTEA